MSKDEKEIPVFKKTAVNLEVKKPVAQKVLKPSASNISSIETRKNKIIIGLVFTVLILFGILSSRMVIRFALEIEQLQGQLSRAQGKISRLESDREKMLMNNRYDDKRERKLSSTITAKNNYITELEIENRKLQRIVDEKESRNINKVETLSQLYSNTTINHLPLDTKTPRVAPVLNKVDSEWRDADVGN